MTEAKFPNNAQVLKRDFNLNDEQLKKLFILPHTVSFELYVRAFQYKVLNSISFTNTKLFKIGFVTEDKCSFCKSQSETLSHLLFDCIKTRSFWRTLFLLSFKGICAPNLERCYCRYNHNYYNFLKCECA